MMTVTDIRPARKKLCSVYIDGEYAMKLDAAVLEENCIKPGVRLDDERLHKLVKESEYRRSKERALWLLSGRDYSRSGLYDKLRREASDETTEEVIERMEELGLVDDESYARRLAHDLLYIKKLSKRGALYKLMEKGIDKGLAEEILDEFELDPVEQLVELIERKYKNKLEDEKDRRRTVAALQRLGYSWGDIRAALEEFEE